MIQAEKQLKYTSAFFSNNLNKQEYLTDEDLDLKPNTVEQARLEYSPLGKFFNKGLKEEDNKEGLLKMKKSFRLKLLVRVKSSHLFQKVFIVKK